MVFVHIGPRDSRPRLNGAGAVNDVTSRVFQTINREPKGARDEYG